MGELFGNNVLVATLKDENKLIRDGAGWVLGKTEDGRLREYSSEIEGWISGLKSWNSYRRQSAAALKKITWEDFGEDYDAWQRWWEQYKGKFLEKN